MSDHHKPPTPRKTRRTVASPAKKANASGKAQVDTPEIIDVKTLSDKDAFLSRELGSVAFNRTVLDMAESSEVPLLERLRYLCIANSNLDEFFEIRLAGLRERIDADDRSLSTDGRSAKETYAESIKAAHALQKAQYRVFNEQLLPALKEQGIQIFSRDEWSEPIREWLKTRFEQNIFPLLTPIGLDPAHPFPRLSNKTLNF